MKTSLRYVITVVLDVLLHRRTLCCGCGVMHRTRNRDSSFAAFCSEDCFADNMPPGGYPLSERM